MLYQVRDDAWACRELRRHQPAYEHMVSAWSGWNADGAQQYIASEGDTPAVVGLRRANRFILAGEPAGVAQAIDDLYHHRQKLDPGWPDEEVRQAWRAEGRPWLALEVLGPDLVEHACCLGFTPAPDDPLEEGAYFYCITGEPHLSAEVQHPCRVTQGMELYDLMRRSVDYDASGEYTRRCLEHGASFVCEVDGQPVCWSCTHVNNCLGMIYTPPEHRRHGYGRSLAAFQIDYSLRERGLAHCFVLVPNTPSRGMMDSLGVPHLPLPMIRRKLYWPDGAAAPED